MIYAQDFDIISYLQDKGVPHIVGPAKNVGSDYVGLTCMFCGDHGTHLGINLYDKRASCFRCGGKSLVQIIQALEDGCSVAQANTIMYTYKLRILRTARSSRGLSNDPFTLPKDAISPLPKQHRKFLETRNFDPDELQRLYNLQAITISDVYKYRIVIPVYIYDVLVTYQTLDITNQQVPKYKSCNNDVSVIPLKHTLYNLDSVTHTAVIVEGVTDVWRLGSGAVATFGMQWSLEQITLLATVSTIRRVFVMFDGEDPNHKDFENKHTLALKQAEKLCWNLKPLFQEVNLLELPEGDPCELDENDVKHLRKELGL